MQNAAGARDARKFGDDALCVRDRMNDVAADGKIERSIGRSELVNALAFERDARRERSVMRSRQVEMFVDDVDAEYACLRKERRQSRTCLTGSAARVEDVGVGPQIVACK